MKRLKDAIDTQPVGQIRSVDAMAPEIDSPFERVDVCICTYQRESLAATLQSVADQEQLDAVKVRVIVADNAADPIRRAQVEAQGRDLGLDLIYVHAPARNISIARNACLESANGDWVAFLDDDEVAGSLWLQALLRVGRRDDCEAVLGPVLAIYPAHTSAWILAADLHSSRPTYTRGKVRSGYTGNVLVRRSFLESAGLRFREEFGRTGGEDLQFFYELQDAGGRIAFAPEAVAMEAVPLERTSLKWVLRRSFRAGQSHGSRLRERRIGASWPAPLMLATAKALVLSLGAAVSIGRPGRWAVYLSRSALQCGVACRLAGLREIKLY